MYLLCVVIDTGMCHRLYVQVRQQCLSIQGLSLNHLAPLIGLGHPAGPYLHFIVLLIQAHTLL